ncbi:MAG: histidine phosphatase family protein [Bacilli bacterium]|nr:histidine phosphatase family protein [Bacilli bacterium]
MKLYVVRHGETNENIHKIMQGNMETDLNKVGEEQAISLRNKVKEANINFIISSPKRRAIETAKLAAPDISIMTDNRLLSRDHGEFQGMARTEINLEEYWNIKKNIQYERAETVGEIFNRVSSFLNDVSVNYSDKHVMIVTHSGICRVLYYYFNGFPHNGDLTEYESTNCSFEEYDLDKIGG